MGYSGDILIDNGDFRQPFFQGHLSWDIIGDISSNMGICRFL